MNINNPSQPQTESEFDYAFGDELQFIGANGEMLEAGGLLSKIIGTKKSRSVVKEKVATAANKVESKVTTAAKKVVSAPAKLVSKVVGTKESRAVVKGKVTKGAKTIFGKVKTVGLAPQRTAFLAIVKINGFGLASDLKKEKDTNSAKWQKIRNTTWAKLGGNRTTFDNTVVSGAKKKALKINFKKNKSADGIDTWEYPTGIEETVALVAAAAPIIIVVFNALGKKKDENLDAETEAAIAAEATAQAAETAELQKEQDEINATQPEYLRDSNMNTWLWVGGITAGLLLTGIIIYSLKKKS